MFHVLFFISGVLLSVDLRYCWCGDPLLMTSCDLDPPCCEHCGADRVFEFQIMPALVYQLNLPNVQGKNDVV